MTAYPYLNVSSTAVNGASYVNDVLQTSTVPLSLSKTTIRVSARPTQFNCVSGSVYYINARQAPITIASVSTAAVFVPPFDPNVYAYQVFSPSSKMDFQINANGSDSVCLVSIGLRQSVACNSYGISVVSLTLGYVTSIVASLSIPSDLPAITNTYSFQAQISCLLNGFGLTSFSNYSCVNASGQLVSTSTVCIGQILGPNIRLYTLFFRILYWPIL